MLWIKAFHIIFMVTWFAALFYLPRLFVYHASCTDDISHKRFCIMERRLFWGIMTPGAVLTAIFGFLLLNGYAWAAYRHTGWLHTKLLLVACLIVYHAHCGWLLRDFARGQNKRSALWYRYYNELPTVLLISIILLVVVKPF